MKYAIFMIKWAFILFSWFIVPSILFFLWNFIICGKRFKKGKYKKIGYGNFIKKLCFEFPKKFVEDQFERDPDFFQEFGLHVFAGEQGSGKTMAMVHALRRLQKMYPKLRVKTNFHYKFEDGRIEDYHDILESENDIYGEIDCIDEIQNWFNSNAARSFPVEMLTEITQQRKQRKCIFATSQVFMRVAKPIREQTFYLYLPTTIFGCLTIVRKYKPIIDQKGDMKDKKLRKIYFFVHSEELRNSYDTFEKIKNLSKQGFKEENLQVRSGNYEIIREDV